VWRDSELEDRAALGHNLLVQEIRIGDLVAPSPEYRASMGTGEGAAILMGVLRGSGRLYYPATDQSYWVPLRLVRPIPPEVLPPDCLERFLADLLLFLDADECVVERLGPDSMGLSVDVPRITRGQLDQLAARLARNLRDLEIAPASMRDLTLKLELGGLPAAAGGGR
jgi:hypothetical protein